MQEQNKRRFTLLDAIAFVAATAAGFALIRLTWETSPLEGIEMSIMRRLLFECPYAIENWVTPVVVCWCIANLVCAITPRGPGRWHRLHAPGLIACVAVVLIVAVETGRNLANDFTNSRLALGLERVTVNWNYTSWMAILVAWATLRLVDGWHPVRDWPDRLGRLIGWSFLFGAVFCFCCAMIVPRME